MSSLVEPGQYSACSTKFSSKRKCGSLLCVFALFRVIFALGISMTSLNVPVEWLSLGFEWTWMLLFEDVRQGMFYSTLFSFWIIFCGEHLMVSTLYLFSTVLWPYTLTPIMPFLFTNPSGPKSEKSALSVLVAGWASGVWLIYSPHIWLEWKVKTLHEVLCLTVVSFFKY